MEASVAWSALAAHAKRLRSVRIESLFDAEADRIGRLQLEGAGLVLDVSKQLLDRAAGDALLALAEARELPAQRERLFGGESVNETEGRAALHMALRGSESDRYRIGAVDVMPEVMRTLDRMRAFSEDVRCGRHAGWTGAPVTDVVNVGIGGSDLGPALACEALGHLDPGGPRTHFLSNVDGHAFASLARTLDPGRTLFIIASKTFATRETMLNAESAHAWLTASGMPGSMAKRHLAAVSANVPGALAFGIAPENVFPSWDWVGGRFSLWSAVGLAIAIRVGFDRFRELLVARMRWTAIFATPPRIGTFP